MEQFEFDPERSPNGTGILYAVEEFVASDVVIAYMTATGELSFVPTPYQQRMHMIALAPGISYLAVSHVTLPALDYRSSDMATTTVSYIRYKGGEHVATPQQEDIRLSVLSLCARHDMNSALRSLDTFLSSPKADRLTRNAETGAQQP